MKMSLVLVLTALVCIIGAIAQAPNPALPEAKVTVRVVDREGTPLPGAQVSLGFEYNTGSGTKSDEKHGVSDENGLFSAAGKTSGYVAYAATKEGYYRTEGVPYRSFTKEKGQWQPYNPTLDVVLKPIINPIPMYARLIETDLPVADEPVGFDLVEADWIAPHGHGKVADFVFKLTKRVVSYKDYGAELQLTFSNKMDGIQEFTAPPKKGSQLRSPHQAPSQGYGDSFSLLQGSSAEGSYGFNKENQNYLFRVRIVVDEKGEIVSALYGKIYGEIRYFPVDHKTAKLRFTYYLNPNDNDRNIEFDPARNLFPHLNELEKPTAP